MLGNFRNVQSKVRNLQTTPCLKKKLISLDEKLHLLWLLANEIRYQFTALTDAQQTSSIFIKHTRGVEKKKKFYSAIKPSKKLLNGQNLGCEFQRTGFQYCRPRLTRSWWIPFRVRERGRWRGFRTVGLCGVYGRPSILATLRCRNNPCLLPVTFDFPLFLPVTFPTVPMSSSMRGEHLGDETWPLQWLRPIWCGPVNWTRR